MNPGYSGKSVAQKLGIKPGALLTVIDPPAGYLNMLGEMPPDVVIEPGKPTAQVPFIHLFVTRREVLQTDLPSIADLLAPKGMLWISWPKQSSKVATDITEDTLREIALPLGLVDTKVCAVSEVWSGLKFLWRVKPPITTVSAPLTPHVPQVRRRKH